jgi:hypothetical protein
MSPVKSVISAQISAAQKAIANTQANAEIKALVAAYGYNDEMLKEGQQLYEAAQDAYNAQARAESAQLLATQAFKATEAQAFKAYQDLAKIARATIDPAELPGLNLNVAMPKGEATFGPAADRLFANAANVGALAKFGYDAAKLAAERAKIDAYAAASNNRDIAKGAAQQATTEQDAALQALDKWTAQYIKIAKVALNGTQLLEKLGVIARTSPTAAQRAARQKKTTTPPALSKIEEPAAPKS